MPKVEIRKVFRIGTSLAIIVPAKWARGKVKAGDEVIVVASEGLFT